MNKEKRVIIDTNIWVYYLNKDSEFHHLSKEVIENEIKVYGLKKKYK